MQLGGGNMGSNGTHEFYVFKVSSSNANGNNTPSGQPLPGIIATLVVGGGALVYLKKRKKLYEAK
jgi:LPXTG-motif cell wall-anchored protein